MVVVRPRRRGKKGKMWQIWLKVAAIVLSLSYVMLSLLFHHIPTSDWASLQRDALARPCTFDQLWDTFGKQDVKFQSAPDNNDGDCWSLKDEIMRIPLSNIENRNRLTTLGHGKLSGVYRGVIQHQHGTCTVAIKSDHCYYSPFTFLELPKSCVADATHLYRPRSYMGAEYTGALLWYASQKVQQNLSGVLPTWGVLVDETRPLHHPFGAAIAGYPHTDPSIRGFVLPQWEFTTALDVLTRTKQDGPSLSTSVWHSHELAQHMLPAAHALAFAGSIGLAFRDLLEKNVGILPNGNAFVYDNSYMGLRPVEHCSNITCRFCQEDVFSEFDDYYHHVVKGIEKGHPYILGDMHNFRNVIRKLCTVPPDKDRASRLADSVFHTRNVHHLVQVLEQYANESYAVS